ncbi:MAG: membrane protein insertase YidC [Puniceicoccales bacterium]|jgi:YidC/Oxa1 family membrane protein insertase|nr:membrane protein insertase YidC [Puniceicoccales bacterium]
MEKKHLFLGLTAIALAFWIIIGENRRAVSQAGLAEIASAQTAPQVGWVPGAPSVAPKKAASVAAGKHLNCPGFILENSYIRGEISPIGGGIRSIALKKYPATLGSEKPWIFDDYDNTQDALSLWLVSASGMADLRDVCYDVVQSKEDSLLLRGSLSDGTTIDREYQLTKMENGDDSYCIQHVVRLNQGTTPSGNRSLHISLGSLPSTEGDIHSEHLNFVHYDGKKARFLSLQKFAASRGFFGLGSRPHRENIAENGRVVWGAIKNQFFAAILTPQQPAVAFHAAPIELQGIDPSAVGTGIGATLVLPLLEHESGATAIMDYYVGPKEYTRLDRLGQRQDLVMQFGWFGFISKLLLLCMNAIHWLIPNWGLTIILLTLLVKLILWPLTNAQIRSSREMAKVQPYLESIRARYKNNPQRVQQETLQLFREHKINPAAGCLPVFFQIPIIIGLYFMLRTASELRFANFLWIKDLAVMDTVGHLGGFPINPMPILMSVAAFFQMRMTPMTTQNAMQKRIFQAMPMIFLFFCYRLPSGLVLYWTVQNLLSIVQQGIINRRLKTPPQQKPLGRWPKHPCARSQAERPNKK